MESASSSNQSLITFGRNLRPDHLPILYRDTRGWCAHCQTVQIFLEEKKIPHRIFTEPMDCYGSKSDQYQEVAGDAPLPVLELPGQFGIAKGVENIIEELELKYHPLGKPLGSRRVHRFYVLTNELIRAWSSYLVTPSVIDEQEEIHKSTFLQAFKQINDKIENGGPFLLGQQFTVADVILIPWIERICASIYYFKGLDLKDPSKYYLMCRWLQSMEKIPSYSVTQSSYYTLVQALPTTMKHCATWPNKDQKRFKDLVENGPFHLVPETYRPDDPSYKKEAFEIITLNMEKVINAAQGPHNPEDLRNGIQLALDAMMHGTTVIPPTGTGVGLYYIADRIMVPRDMSIWAARHLRTALVRTAQKDPTFQQTKRISIAQASPDVSVLELFVR